MSRPGDSCPSRTGAPSPAWAIAGDRLMVGGSLDALKTQIGQAAEGKGLAELSAVASRLKTEPVMLTYQDTKTIVEQSIGMLRTVGPLGAAAAGPARDQVRDARVARIQSDRLACFAADQHACGSRNRRSSPKHSKPFPSSAAALSAVPVAGLSAGYLGPAESRRPRRHQQQAMNNLKQISLAMLNGCGRYVSGFPPPRFATRMANRCSVGA